MKRNLLFGLLQRRECLLPTWRGLLLLLGAGTGLVLLAILNIQPFLTRTEPVPAEVLVVEGWVPDYVLEEAKAEFERGHYSRLYVTGGLIEAGGVMSMYKSFAELGAVILVHMGINRDVIEAVPAPAVRRDRTYASALALKNRLERQDKNIKSFNLLSIGVHARRSHLLYQRAFGSNVRIGIIAIEDREYAHEHWWKFSDGVRTVSDEFFAYLYAVLVFPFVEP